MTSVLISGAGIAGSALAALLCGRGCEVTVVEHAPELRAGGQAVDVRGVALEVLARLGVLEPARDLRTRVRGMSVLDAAGAEVDRSTTHALSSGRLDSEDIEVLREDLGRLLYERARGDAAYVFGDGVTALTEEPGGVRVDFACGPARRFDLVVGADGLHSAVRRLAFGPEEGFSRHLGSYLSVFGADNFLGLEDWQVWLRDGGAGFGIMPVRGNRELRIAFGFESAPLARGADLRALVVERLAALHWEGDRLAKAAAGAPDFYCDAMAQIHLERWSRGRTVLLGDAGYCPSPLSGQGTSLALVGAYVLAEELGRTSYEPAFSAYETRMRPFVAVNQALATENPGGPASEESMERAKWAIDLDEGDS
ncbi:FAD-dependent monooxygenase [Streptomyces sp. NPDC015131]|uniref:FAD-dependent monooxygenase n=1 Tax=Streptomyces sp. NPDC015131 TaxID=3364941 RepID=UPI003700EB88